MKNTNEKRVQWHPACFAALNLEFSENKEDLEFFQEQAVNDLPLRIDALVIKKTHNRKIRNEIGENFRWYNLVEYKSPDDELTFNSFLKGIASNTASNPFLVTASPASGSACWRYWPLYSSACAY